MFIKLIKKIMPNIEAIDKEWLAKWLALPFFLCLGHFWFQEGFWMMLGMPALFIGILLFLITFFEYGFRPYGSERKRKATDMKDFLEVMKAYEENNPMIKVKE